MTPKVEYVNNPTLQQSDKDANFAILKVVYFNFETASVRLRQTKCWHGRAPRLHKAPNQLKKRLR